MRYSSTSVNNTLIISCQNSKKDFNVYHIRRASLKGPRPKSHIDANDEVYRFIDAHHLAIEVHGHDYIKFLNFPQIIELIGDDVLSSPVMRRPEINKLASHLIRWGAAPAEFFCLH